MDMVCGGDGLCSAPHALWYEGCLAASQPVSGVAWCVWGRRVRPAVSGVSPRETEKHQGNCRLSSREVPWAGWDLGSSSFLELNGDCLSSVMICLEIVIKFE